MITTSLRVLALDLWTQTIHLWKVCTIHRWVDIVAWQSLLWRWRWNIRRQNIRCGDSGGCWDIYVFSETGEKVGLQDPAHSRPVMSQEPRWTLLKSLPTWTYFWIGCIYRIKMSYKNLGKYLNVKIVLDVSLGIKYLYCFSSLFFLKIITLLHLL